MKKIMFSIFLAVVLMSCNKNQEKNDNNIVYSYSIQDTIVNGSDTVNISYSYNVKDTMVNGEHSIVTTYNF